MIEHERTGWVDHFTWALSRMMMVLPAVIVTVMSIEVMMRYIFARPTLWANELSLWLAGAVYLLAGLYAMQQRSHIRITLLYDLAPRWLRHTFDLLSLLFLLIFIGAVIWGGFGEAYAKLMRWEKFGTAWDPPIPATLKPLILIVLVLTALQGISNLIRDWNRVEEGLKVPDEIDIDIEALRRAEEEYAKTHSPRQ
jgi:TRAP-type mannitol/chloroaromatic compound transport system permease small subunit